MKKDPLRHVWEPGMVLCVDLAGKLAMVVGISCLDQHRGTNAPMWRSHLLFSNNFDCRFIGRSPVSQIVCK